MATSVLVFDSNLDALDRRVALVAELVGDPAGVIGCSSSSAALLLAETLPDGTPVLVDLFATDRSTLDRPGQRLMRRLVGGPRTAHVRPIAWSAQPAADVVASVRGIGGLGFVAATRDRARERDELARALRGEEVWPTGDLATGLADATAWTGWFESHYGLAWAPWIEPVLVRLASGRERTAVVPELLDQGAARTEGQAVGRLRKVARAVAGEHRNSAAAVAGAASLALSQIAAHRPLAERPPVNLSLEQAARIVGAEPSLVRAAALTDEEIETIVSIEGLIAERRLSDRVSVGAPPADLVRNERYWAAGRRAHGQGAGKGEIDQVVEGLLERLDEALLALDDARNDALYHPESRAAAALRLAGERPELGVPEVEEGPDGPLWRGRTPELLARSADLGPAQLGGLWSAVDALLAPGGTARAGRAGGD